MTPKIPVGCSGIILLFRLETQPLRLPFLLSLSFLLTLLSQAPTAFLFLLVTLSGSDQSPSSDPHALLLISLLSIIIRVHKKISSLTDERNRPVPHLGASVYRYIASNAANVTTTASVKQAVNTNKRKSRRLMPKQIYKQANYNCGTHKDFSYTFALPLLYL